jgi:hypothetical protein
MKRAYSFDRKSNKVQLAKGTRTIREQISTKGTIKPF